MTTNPGTTNNDDSPNLKKSTSIWQMGSGSSLPKASRDQMARPFDRHGRPLYMDLSTNWKLYSLPHIWEYFISVDHFAIWRRHIVWSKANGDKLRDHMTQRFASNMVFMSLMLSAEIAVLFSPSTTTEIMRQKLSNGDYHSYEYWAGVVLCISVFLVLCCLVATFTAWAMVSVVSDVNAHVVLRSSVGLLATQLPSRLIVMAVYTFFLWLILFMFILMPKYLSILITVLAISLLALIVSLYSSFGRMIMYTGAMGPDRIIPKEEEEKMLPYQLYATLVEKATESKANNISVTTQYRLVDLENGSLRSQSERPQDIAKPT